MSVSTLPFAGLVEDVLHGVRVTDPYRWLEDRSLPQTVQWIREQQQNRADYFSACPGIETITSRVREYLDTEILDQPAKVGDRYFYRKRSKAQQQACIYVREISTGKDRLLVDPCSQGPFTSVGIHRISDDGSLIAYETISGGAARKTIGILDVESGRILPSELEEGFPRGLAFTPNNDGFYYCHDTKSDSDEHTIRLHRFDEPLPDRVVFRAPRVQTSRLVLSHDLERLGAIWFHPEGSQFLVDFSIAPLADDLTWTKIFTNKTAPYTPIFCHGRLFVLHQGDHQHLTVTELTEDGRETRTVVPERSTAICQILIAPDRLYVSYLDRGVTEVHAYSFSGEYLGVVEVPEDGSVQLVGNHSPNERNFFYTYESFNQPPSIFEYVPDAKASRLWHRRSSPSDSARCQIRSLLFPSKDGTEIPLTLVSLAGANMKHPVPAIMTTYGGFGVTMTPQFSVLVAIMLEYGATFAIPHVRGGGEFGPDWHEAGRGRNRQTSFDDFIAAAEWLCSEGITTREQLGIFGGCNSGLLVAAAMTQRPELFGAVLCIAPLLDMVRYESFLQAAKWRHEFGTVQNDADFHALFSYSPYHHVDEHVNYPPVLFVTGDKDEQCDPAHVRKMAARLQYRDAQQAPVLVDYSEERGHSPVLPLATRVEALARRIGFLCDELGMEVHDDKAPV